MHDFTLRFISCMSDAELDYFGSQVFKEQEKRRLEKPFHDKASVYVFEHAPVLTKRKGIVDNDNVLRL